MERVLVIVLAFCLITMGIVDGFNFIEILMGAGLGYLLFEKQNDNEKENDKEMC